MEIPVRQGMGYSAVPPPPSGRSRASVTAQRVVLDPCRFDLDKPWKKPDGEENTVRVQRHVARKFPTTSDENQSESEADESCKLSTEEEGKFSEKKFGTAKRSYPPICDGNPGRRSVSVSEISIHSRSDERSPEM